MTTKVYIEMDLLGTATVAYPLDDYPINHLIEMVDNDRERIIQKIRMDRKTATSMVILKAVDGHGKQIMGKTMVEPNFADAGCFLESALINISPKDLYRAMYSLCMDEEFILGTLPRLARKLLP